MQRRLCASRRTRWWYSSYVHLRVNVYLDVAEAGNKAIPDGRLMRFDRRHSSSRKRRNPGTGCPTESELIEDDGDFTAT